MLSPFVERGRHISRQLEAVVVVTRCAVVAVFNVAAVVNRSPSVFRVGVADSKRKCVQLLSCDKWAASD